MGAGPSPGGEGPSAEGDHFFGDEFLGRKVICFIHLIHIIIDIFVINVNTFFQLFVKNIEIFQSVDFISAPVLTSLSGLTPRLRWEIICGIESLVEVRWLSL